MKSKTEATRADNMSAGNDVPIWKKLLSILLILCLVLYWGFMFFDDFMDNMEWESKYDYVYLGEMADRNEYFQVKNWPAFPLDNISDYIDTGEKVINRRFVNLGLSCLELSGTPGDYEIIEASYEIVLPRFLYLPLFGTASFSYYDGDWDENCSFGKEFGWMTKRNSGPRPTIQYVISDETVEKYWKIALARPEWKEGMKVRLIFRPEQVVATYAAGEEWGEDVFLVRAEFV